VGGFEPFKYLFLVVGGVGTPGFIPKFSIFLWLRVGSCFNV
jgi:hypothetical protein